jgi:hypothetical protein
MNAPDLLSRTLRAPDAARALSMGEWDLLLRQAHHAGLTSRLYHVLRQAGCDEAIPAPARWHFEAADTLAARQQVAVRWEIAQVKKALGTAGIPLLLLKGAAYVAAGLPAAQGRLFNDLDILVPREALDAAESALMLAGWHATGLSAYDQRYYRRWMHEIPPLQHVQRATVIDVHHAILPDTARSRPDPARLRAQAVAVPGLPGVRVLSATDRILHSAAHLFHDGELPHGLRDLSDLDLLLRDAAREADFWPRLVARAGELELGRSLFHALRYVRHFLATPVPASVDVALARCAPARPVQALLDALFTRALAPMHPSYEDRLTPAARLAAYVRAHWLRMPPRLLLPHLLHKALRNEEAREAKAA